MRHVSGLLSMLLVGCGGATMQTGAAAPGKEPVASYEVTWLDRGTLEVVVRSKAGGFSELALERGAERFMSGVTAVDHDGKPAMVAVDRGIVRIPACAKPCSIRYRLDLDGTAEAFQNAEFAGRVGDALFAPSTTWLLHPVGDPRGRFELVVTTPKGVEHVNGLQMDDDGKFVADLSDLPQAPYAAFGGFRRRTVSLESGSIDVAIAGSEAKLGDEAIENWIREGALNVEGYLGRFPIERAAVFVVVEPGTTVGHGSALGNGGASILVRVGEDVGERALAKDWIMTHEMVHLTMPGLHARHNWMEEGLATYLEPVARARRGILAPEQVWAEWYVDMRQGLPRPDDGGLDGNGSWGRTYWGGAIFWLLAEVKIREATHGTKSVRDCLLSTIEAGGNLAGRWSAKRFVTTCDKAFPEPIVGPLYELHSREAVHVDLESLFTALGVKRMRRGVLLDDSAPDAAMRWAITGEKTRFASAPMPFIRHSDGE